MSVRVFVCMIAPRLLMTSGVIWTLYDWLSKGYSLHNIMAAEVSINSTSGLRIEVHCKS